MKNQDEQLELAFQDITEGITPDPDDWMDIVYCHGLQGHPLGKKCFAIEQYHGQRIIAPDLRNLELDEQIAAAEEATRDFSEMTLIGSSFGGLVAALLYQYYSERFKNYLLLAPALHHERAQEIDSVPEQGAIIYGSEDDRIPFIPIRTFAHRFNLELIIVEDDHRLHQSLDTINLKIEEYLS